MFALAGGASLALMPGPGATPTGVRGSERTAWFEDPDGNVLRFHEPFG